MTDEEIAKDRIRTLVLALTTDQLILYIRSIETDLQIAQNNLALIEEDFKELSEANSAVF